MVISYVAKQCHSVIVELFQASGSRSNYHTSLIGRFHRDANALATHAIFEYDHVANLYGGALLDVDIPPNSMI